MNFTLLVPILLLTITFHILRRRHILHKSNATLAASLSCLPSITIRDPLGISRLLAVKAYLKKKKLPLLYGEAYAKYARFTIPLPLPGMTGFITAEPENFQALLSTEAKRMFFKPRGRS